MSDTIVCPRCGTANPAGSQYCDQCSLPLRTVAAGAAGAPVAPAGVRAAAVPSAPVQPPIQSAPSAPPPAAAAPPPVAAAPAIPPPTPVAVAAAPTSARPARAAGPPILLIGGILLLLVIFVVGGLGLILNGGTTPAAPTPDVLATTAAFLNVRGTEQAATNVASTGGAATVVATAPPAAATATSAAVVPPTSAPLPSPTVAALAGVTGTVHFQDKKQPSDTVLLTVAGLTSHPAGKAFFAWLNDSATGTSQLLGRLVPNGAGQATLSYSDAKGANLLATYDRVLITLEDPEATPRTPSPTLFVVGQVPPLALIHIRHLLVSFPETPNQTGLEVGLRDQITELADHATFMKQSQDAGDLAGVHLHAEHLVNIIEGAKGADFGDLDHDGKVTNPGDGFGLLANGDQVGYLLGVQDHADLAAAADDATAALKQQAAAIDAVNANINGWVTTIRDRALAAAQARTLQATAPLVAEIASLAPQVLQAETGATGGESATLPGYAQAQLMADMSLGPPAPGTTEGGTNGGGAAPTASLASQAPAPTVPPANSGAGLTIVMQGHVFQSGSVTVKAGTKITWVNQDNVPHTVTADDNTWDSGLIQPGQSFTLTAPKAGRYPYYCALHGGPGGQGMSAVLTVEP